MMDIYGIVVILLFGHLGIVAEDNGGKPLFPNGYNWDYTYSATVSTGAKKPQNAHSQWKILGKINIKSENNKCLFQLSDIRTTVYNGPDEEDPNIVFQHRTDLNKLTEPFLVTYENGLLVNIYLDSSEELWASNIKRAIASLLQIDVKMLSPSAFLSNEKNIYGDCIVEYNVLSDVEKNILKVRKFVDHNKCKNSPFQAWSSAPLSVCPSKHQNSVISSSERNAIVEQTNNSTTIVNIVADGGLYLQPFEAHGDAHFIKTYQILSLVKTSLQVEPLANVSKLEMADITYQHDTYDFSSGRHKISKNDKIASVKKDIEQMTEDFENHYSVKNPNKLHSRTLQMLYFQLRGIDISALHQIYADIGLGTSYQQETKANIFLELLPQIGSEASTEFIKELILSRNIKDITAVKLLSTLPFYIENSNDELLASFEPLLSLGKEFSTNVRHTAVLSFATLVYKTFAASKCSAQTFEKYARKYFDYFAASDEYEQRMLYLEGLNNLQLGSVMQFLKPIIAKESSYQHHIRFLAVWASMSMASASPVEVYETYLPILHDRSEHLELRISAFIMLLLSEPTTGRLLSLYWFMQTEPDRHLYNFYYTTLKSMKHTTYPCYLHLGSLVSQIIRFAKQPASNKFWVSGNYLLDYSDDDRGFGSMMQLFLIGNPKTDRLNVFYLTINNYAMGRNINQFSVYLKLQGVAESVLDMLTRINGRDVKVEKLVEILKLAKIDLRSPDPVHIEIITQIEGKTVFCQHINETTFNLLSNVLMELQNLRSGYHINYQHVGIALASRELYPSDVGTTIWLGSLAGASASLRGNFTYSLDDAAVTRKNDLDFRYSFQTQHSLLAYNPIMDTYHGIERQKVIHGIFPLIMNISFDVSKWEMIVSLQQSTGPPPSVLFHTRSISFIRNQDNEPPFLKQLCLDCNAQYELKENKLLINNELINVESEDLLHKLRISVFSCDSPYSLRKIYNDINFSHRANFNVYKPTKHLLTLQHIMDYITFIPSSGRCGMAFTIESTTQEQPTVVWILRTAREPGSDLTQSLSGDKIKIYTKLLHRLNQITVNYSLDASLVLERSPDQTLYNTKFTLDRKTHNKHEKLCVQATANRPPWQSDIFSYKPIMPVTMTGSASWGFVKDAVNCPENQTHIYWKIHGEITQEQKDEANKAQIWPFKQCKASKGNLTFTPLTEHCYRASVAVSTPRRYALSLIFENVPNWLEEIMNRLKYIVSLFSSSRSIDDLEISSVLNATVEYSQQNETMYIDVNRKRITIEHLPSTAVAPFLLNVRFPTNSEVAVNLGLINSCVVTPSDITNIFNTTIQNEVGTTEFLALADCSNNAKFALFVNKKVNRKALSCTLYTGGYSASISQITHETVVKVNGEIVDAKNGYQYPIETAVYDYKVWHREDDVIEIESKYSRVWLHYTKEYILITTPGFYKGQLCGKCIDAS